MLCSAHQPAYLAWLGLLHKYASADVWISWDDVPAEDSGYENRNQILGADGQPQWLTVPVRKGRDIKLKDLEICTDQPWARKHYRTLELAYGKAPNWKVYGPWFKDLYERKWTRLVDLNQHILDFLLVQFKLGTRMEKLSALGIETTKSQAIIDACRKVGANHYLFGAKGRNYADLALFRSAGIEAWEQEYVAVEYPQLHPGFVPNLSAFDLLLNVDRDKAIEVMRAGGRTRRMA